MEHINEILLALAVGSPIVTWVAAFTSVKVSLNGTKQQVQRIEDTVTRMDEKMDDHADRIAVIEARCYFREQVLPTPVK